jgi:MinD superfamily P-loop ATPase
MRIAIASGKGGTGKTTVAASMALALIKAGLRVTLADCDVEEPNAYLFLPGGEMGVEEVTVSMPVIDKLRCTYCGKCADFCKFNAISVFLGNALVFPGLCHSCGGCSLICPESAIKEVPRRVGIVKRARPMEGIELITGVLDEGEHSSVPVINAVKGGLPKSGLAIMDCAPGTACNMVSAVRGCDYCILVTEPTPFGLHDLSLARDVLEKMGIPNGVVINKSTGDDSIIEDYCSAHGMHVIGKIPYDDAIARAYSTGKAALSESPLLERVLIGAYEKAAKEAEKP